MLINYFRNVVAEFNLQGNNFIAVIFKIFAKKTISA